MTNRRWGAALARLSENNDASSGARALSYVRYRKTEAKKREPREGNKKSERIKRPYYYSPIHHYS